MSNEITIENEGKESVAGKIEEIYTDIYGLDGWKRVSVMSGIKIMAKDTPNQVLIRSVYGDTTVDVSKAQATVESRIKQMENTPSNTGKQRDLPDRTSGTEGTSGDNTRIDNRPKHSDELPERNDPAQVTFTPPRTKDEARYHEPAEGPNPELDCMDCAHYIEGGNCHIVQGDVNPEGHCENYYADVGVFAKITDDSDWNINLRLWGERWRPKAKSMFKSAESSARKLSERVQAMITSNWRK